MYPKTGEAVRWFDPRIIHSAIRFDKSPYGRMRREADKLKREQKRARVAKKQKRLNKDTSQAFIDKHTPEARVRAEVAANRQLPKGKVSTPNKAVTAPGPSTKSEWNLRLAWRHLEGKTRGLAAKGWVGTGIKWGASVLAFSFAMSTLQRTVGRFTGPVIPEHYERGYDIIDQNFTDFGSPVKVAKAAHKVIAPYASTVRNAKYTTVASTMRKNIALTQARTAIEHWKY